MATEEPTATKPTVRTNEILHLSFNQDFTALAMGTTENYALFSINQESRVDEIHSSGVQAVTNIPHLPYEEVIIIERLFASSLLAIVTRQAPRVLRMCHFKKGSEICAPVFPNDIRAVKMNRKRLVVCLEESIFIHDMTDMKLLHSMRETPVNPDGICALSPSKDNPFLAYPGSSITGEIQLFNTKALKPTLLLSAHEGPLAALAFDSSGTRIASASTRGTVIRVHHTVDGTRLFEFRRSARRVATIYSLAFNPDATFLAVSSNTGTIHVFRLLEPNEKPSEAAATTWMGTFGQMLGGVLPRLPRQTAEVLTQERAFAVVHLSNSTTKTLVGMNTFDQILKLFVVGYDGIVHVYEVNTNEGGECKQTSQYMLFRLSDTSLQQIPTGESRESSYPSNTLRSEDKTHRVTPVLTNAPVSEEAESFQTTLSDDGNQTVPT